MRVSIDNSFSTLLIACFFLINLVHSQDNSDFISIDCGVQEDYTDTAKNIHHSSDAQFVNTGISRNISAKFKSGVLNQRLANLRSFPEGTRNCYTLRTTQGKNKKYLIRAWFLYGDYDGNNTLPRFELNIGTNLWDTVALTNASEYSVLEMMHVSPTNFIHVCLVNIGAGTPFISALELRHLNASIYKTQSESMVLLKRYDLGSTATDSPSIGNEYGDELGRIWYSFNIENTTRVSTFIPIDSLNDNAYKLPGRIMEDADKPVNESVRMEYYLDGGNGRTSATRFYVYLHFCEIKQLEDDEVREFDILMNDIPWVESVVPTYLRTSTFTKETPVRGGTVGELWFCLRRTERSTLPPILSAMEIYIEKKLPKLSSNPEDVDAMVNISLSYGVKKNWQGDPCIPLDLSWNGLLCSSADENAPPHILSVNLSSSSLTGGIASALAGLKSLEHLDLSNNNLTGPVPEFLAQLPALKTLNLAGNNLGGSVPKSLLKKSSLSLRTDGNPNLCSSLTCGQTNKKSKIVPIVVPVVISLVILSAIATFWVLKMRRRKVVRTLKSNNQRFSYSEVVSMTNNFEKVIGKGGFGTVYLGHLEDGTEVAVKMLSRSSAQVSEQFWTEAELLTTIHHRNLASLVGYSEEGSNTALIYEYMANGNLRECLSDKSEAILTWGQRLQIAIDSAQALEYLHNGCKPPIIHRDIKTDNILLNENMKAKVADFGLSRIFPQVQGETHVSTGVVGTFGYLDPEYYITGRLTEKSDVYSFGIVLLELITGQPAIIKSEEENTHIVQWVMPLLERGDISTIVDQRLQGDYDNNSVWKALETAVACVPSSPIQRPTMSQVLGDLKECQDMYLGTTGNTQEAANINFNVQSSTGIDYLNSFDLESSMIIPRAR